MRSSCDMLIFCFDPCFAILRISGISYAGAASCYTREIWTWLTSFNSASAGVVLSLAYGFEVADNSDEYVHLADEALKSMGRAGLFGTYYVVRPSLFG